MLAASSHVRIITLDQLVHFHKNELDGMSCTLGFRVRSRNTEPFRKKNSAFKMRCSIEDADSVLEAVNEDGVSDVLQQSMRMEAAKSWMSTSYSQTLSNK